VKKNGKEGKMLWEWVDRIFPGKEGGGKKDKG
jgi:hypothetical protein